MCELRKISMRCKEGEFIAGEYFHVYNHAVSNELLFRTNSDYDYFLDKFSVAKSRYPSTIVSFCLMPNHYHYLMRQDGTEPIYRIFNDAFTSYTLHYNHKYNRKGTLFQGPLQHIHIKTDNYFIQLCKYIHYNPKKARLVDDLRDWKFSNYLEWIGSNELEFFSSEFCEMYPDDFKNYEETINEYGKYIEENEFKKLLFE
jgi:REP-associated tyrosine transposase